MQYEIREPQVRIQSRTSDRRGRRRNQPAVEALEERSLLSAGLHHPAVTMGVHPRSVDQSRVSIYQPMNHISERPRLHFAHPLPRAFGPRAYQQVNLVSDFPAGVEGVNARLQDTNLRNPWGMAINPNGPFWVSDQVTGLSTIYSVGPTRADPTNVVSTLPLVVTIPPAVAQPPAGSPGFNPLTGPTGIVFNGTTGFQIPNPKAPTQSAPALFIFSTLDGQIAAWNRDSGTGAQIVVPHTAVPTEEFTGLALASNSGHNFLYTADPRFPDGIDVFNSSFQIVTDLSPHQFVDPRLPAGFSPYNIQALTVRGVQQLYVAYTTPVGGGGYIGVFNTDGSFIRQFGNGARGPLQTPWGMAVAPSDFGRFSNDLLVGNFGDGRISAFNPVNGRYLGQLTTPQHQPIVIPFLWALEFGNSNQEGGGIANNLYFTAGIAGQYHGLLGAIQAVVTPTPFPHYGQFAFRTLASTSGTYPSFRPYFQWRR